MATQNPVEQEGTYPLPEAQTDRFLFKLIVDYPNAEEENTMMQRWGHVTHQPTLGAVSSSAELLEQRSGADRVYVSEGLQRYILALVRATRELATAGSEVSNSIPRPLTFGASPRATLALAQAVRALAYLRGHDYATPELVQELFLDITRHRIGLTYEAEAERLSPDEILRGVVKRVPVPALRD
jgi:MoxR-like ATPase